MQPHSARESTVVVGTIVVIEAHRRRPLPTAGGPLTLRIEHRRGPCRRGGLAAAAALPSKDAPAALVRSLDDFSRAYPGR
jgi:hypothetical protein